MNSVHAMIASTRRGEPWALARFNDGEMGALTRTLKVVARGDQPVTHALSKDLRWCLQQRAYNLWLGLPCGTCYPSYRVDADELACGHVDQTLAVVQTNRNLSLFKEQMADALQRERVVHWIGGDDQDITNLPFPVHHCTSVPLHDAYTKAKDLVMTMPFSPGDIVFLSCGPLATVLAVRLFLRSPYATFIDIGSTWDPETRDVSHTCHTGKLKPCKECN